MTKQKHLTNELLVRAMDDELMEAEAACIQEHLAQCGECRQKYEEFQHTSIAVHSGLAAIPLDHSFGERENLQQKLEARQAIWQTKQTPERVMRRFGWGMAIAASFALAVVMMPKHKNESKTKEIVQAATTLANAIEAGGETFIPLPYSNPDLPVNASRIVEMQVPISALSDAGIMVEPVSSRAAVSDRSVLADVLMGTDGQPLGVHILE
ncbi:MAG TPA: zf-HC2 domain-containing protein [Bryobacteraceae bacterium]|jgi:anti-sigma factor RsiW